MVRLLVLLVGAGACGRSPYAPRNSQLVSSPTFLRFVARVGEVVEPQVVSVFEARTAELCWRAAVPVSWVSVSRTAGCGPAAIAVSVATRGLDPGTHRTLIEIVPTSPGTHVGAAITVQLDLSAPGWTSLGGPWGGPMTAIAVDPSDANRVVAGGDVGWGLFISSDGGGSFAESPIDFGANVAVSAIALTDSGHGYLTLDRTSSNGVGGVWWSSDHGATWEASTAGDLDLLGLAVHPMDPMTAVAVGAGAWVTQDGGVSWAQTDPDQRRAVTHDSDGFWIGGEDGSLWRSDDGTAPTLSHTFISSSNTLPVRALAALSDGTVLAQTSGSPNRLWRSNDGTTWEQASAAGLAMLPTMVLVADGTNLWALGEGVFLSTDAGEIFAELPVAIEAGLDGKRFVGLGLHAEGDLLAHQSLGLLRHTGDGVAQVALAVDTIRDMELDPTTATLYLTGLFSGAFACDALGCRGLGGDGLTAGQSWNISIDPRNSAHIIVGAAIITGAGVYRSTDFGTRWTHGVPGVPGGTCIYSLERAPEDADVIWIAGCTGFFRSSDGGLSYATVDPDHEIGRVAPTSADVAIYTRSGLRRYDTAVGAHEVLFTSPTPSFVTRTVDGSLWWSADGYGLHRSVDLGTTFEQVTASVGGVRALVMRADDHRQLFLASTDTLLASADGGVTWTDTGVPFPPHSLVLDPDSDLLWVGTHGGGVYRYAP